MVEWWSDERRILCERGIVGRLWAMNSLGMSRCTSLLRRQYSVLSTRYSVLGTRYSVIDTRCPALSLLIAILLAAGCSRTPPASPSVPAYEDPRISFATPYRN